MEILPGRLAELLLFSVLSGAVLGIIYDLLRITRVLMGEHYSEKFRTLRVNIRLRLPHPHTVKNVVKKTKINTPKKHRILYNIVVFTQDLLFMITAGVFVCLLCYYFNNGEFRWFSPVCVAVGFVCYYFTLGKLIMLASEALTYILKTVLLYFIVLFLYPIALLYSVVFDLISRLLSKCRKKALVSYDKRERIKLLHAADRGFLPNVPLPIGIKEEKTKSTAVGNGNKYDIEKKESQNSR